MRLVSYNLSAELTRVGVDAELSTRFWLKWEGDRTAPQLSGPPQADNGIAMIAVYPFRQCSSTSNQRSAFSP